MTSAIMTIGADPADRDGLWMTGTLPGEPLKNSNGGRNALGAMTMFTPVLATAARPLPEERSSLTLTGATAASTPWRYLPVPDRRFAQF